MLTIEPIRRWPRKLTPADDRRGGTFRASYGKTVQLLESELNAIAASNTRIHLAIDRAEIRRDGQLRADAWPEHPGVILTFDKPGTGRVVMPCDAYEHWHTNLRALALSLKALRSVDRYGVTTSGEQYGGWKQLPPGAQTDIVSQEGIDAAAVFVANHGGGVPFAAVLKSIDTYRAAYRRAAKTLHPDANGGRQREEWFQLNRAAAILDAHHGV